MTSTVRQSSAQAATAPDAIRPFQVHIPDSALADLRRRINATRWPDKETVADQSQGIGRTLRGLGAPELFATEMRAAFQSLRSSQGATR